MQGNEDKEERGFNYLRGLAGSYCGYAANRNAEGIKQRSEELSKIL